jgi:hypothetical protein
MRLRGHALSSLPEFASSAPRHRPGLPGVARVLVLNFEFWRLASES